MYFDFDQLSGQDPYKLLVSTVVPRPIAWVVTVDGAGNLNAAPYSFFNAVSGSPPVVVIGIGTRPDGALKDTGTNIRSTGQFVVCLVDEVTARAMNVTAIDFPAGVNELTEAGLSTEPSTRVRPPRIAESPVAMECELHTFVDLGPERAVVLGRVLAMHVRDDAVLDVAKCYVDTPNLKLVGRMHGRGWYARTSDRFEMPRIDLADWDAAKRAAE
jgi:flavin reductase (DIM6/NTAB) family NADH-FMN oxidoreductase RutF